MEQDRRFFVRIFTVDRGGDLHPSSMFELPSEDAAIYAARVGGIENAGAVALVCVAAPDGGLRADVLRRYGMVPKDVSAGALLDLSERA